MPRARRDRRVQPLRDELLTARLVAEREQAHAQLRAGRIVPVAERLAFAATTRTRSPAPAAPSTRATAPESSQGCRRRERAVATGQQHDACDFRHGRAT